MAGGRGADRRGFVVTSEVNLLLISMSLVPADQKFSGSAGDEHSARCFPL